MFSFLNILVHKISLSLHYRIIFAPGAYRLYRLYQNIKIKRIRRKPKIVVLFIIGEASTWKTEMLYQRMLEHPRFQPILGVTESLQVPGSKRPLINYITRMGYDYIDLDRNDISISKLNPDIKFYYKPYEGNYRHGLYFDYNLKSLVCSINYGFSASAGAIAFKHEIKQYAWREFVENKTVIDAMASSGKNVKNKVITGLPLQDYLSLPKETYNDPWNGTSSKKRIIYAPHHSLKGSNGSFIEYATFLEFGEFMLKMAEKYANDVQWVFKPHPSLYSRLIHVWGKEKTDSYYNMWTTMPNTQLELGAYNDIFKHSDAMIHDCSSFMIEYLYTGNPVLFLGKEVLSKEQMHLSQYGYDAYLAHYHASTQLQIETFINQIITGDDPRHIDRIKFLKEHLSIPNGKKACDNIIQEILGTV